MKKILLFLISIFLFIPFVVNAEDTTDEFLINIDILDNGSIKVRELAVLDGDYNGRFRTLEFQNGVRANFTPNISSFEKNVSYNGSNITNIKVGSIDKNKNLGFGDFDKEINYFEKVGYADRGAYGKYTVSVGNGTIEIKTFLPSDYYEAFYLEYIVEDVVVVHDDVAELYWNILGNKYEENIDDFRVKVNLPYEDQSMRVWLKGTEKTLNGKLERTSDKSAFISYDFLGAYNPITVRMMFDNDLVPNASKHSYINGKNYILAVEKKAAEDANRYREKIKRQNSFIICVSLIWMIIVIIVLVLFYLKNDKEDKPDFIGEYYRELPNSYGPEYVEYIMNKSVSEKGFSASILQMISKKVLNVKQSENSKKDYILVADKTKENLLTPEEEMIYSFIINAIGNGYSVTNREIKNYGISLNDANNMMNKFNAWKRMVNRNAKKMNIYQDTSKAKLFTGFIVLTSLAFAYLNFQYETSLLLSLILVILGIGGIIYVCSSSKKTKEGINEYAKWKAFKNFLKDFGRFNEKELPEIALWEQYLVYATILGCAKEVKQAMQVKLRDMNMDTNSSTYMDYVYLNYYMNTDLSHNISSSINHAVSCSRSSIAESQSSSSGGFGGGSSFGGGSGGGGGGGGRF